MKQLKKKLSGQGGFTLVEMLIVVAIIAILIAVSIPMVTGALEKSREAVDQANLRDAIALGNIAFLTGEFDFDADATDKLRYYEVSDDHQGKLTETKGDAETAQCTCDAANTLCGSAKGYIITVTIKADGTVSAAWGSAS